MFHFGAGFMKQKAKRTPSYGIRGILDILEVRGQDLQNNHSNLHSVALIVKYFALFIFYCRCGSSFCCFIRFQVWSALFSVVNCTLKRL